ncbi:MAG: radical SAM protein [Deltaproteobacteria bacterium]|nr:radical SAM protein [Deltaproteobacteria bacterium]
MTSSESMHQLDLADLRPPRVLTLAITDACNLMCCHCWVRSGETLSATHVPLRALCHVIEEFATIGGNGIRITGGEPLCHPHWLDIVQFSRSLSFKTVVIQTNAMLLRDDHIARLRELDFPGFSIQVSLDGVTPLTHDLVRGEGAYSGAMQGIMKLVQEGLGQRIAIFFTEMHHNLHEIPELLDFADRLEIGSVSTGSMVLCGRASETSLISQPEVGQYLELLDRYGSDARFRALYDKLGTVAALEWWRGDTVRHGSCTFVENPYLTQAGRLYPCLLCHTDEFSVTSVFEKGLAVAFNEGAPLWSSLLRISRSRADSIPECQDCPGKRLCAGGCMGRAWGSYGTLLCTDDRCESRRAIYQRGCSPCV